MLFSPDMLMPTGPPPTSVLQKRWLWYLYIGLLVVTFALRLVAIDIAGALLSALMLCCAVIMVRDKMQELSRYTLVYAILCALNFFFDILPLVTELGGRVTRKTVPVGMHEMKDGTKRMIYTTTVKTTPFFDPTQGFMYNMQSLVIILAPMSMVFGMYLSISAHNCIQREAARRAEEDPDEEGAGWGSERQGLDANGLTREQAGVPAAALAAALGRSDNIIEAGANQHPGRPGHGGPRGAQNYSATNAAAQQSHDLYQGRSFKLPA